ncbi:MAG: Gfo/Idh/MocA family oxidoreductase [Planctomycetes bacterium]|nr:Gfo/Idh/MocA family oxidoreductase [Planctomycetota bacterium]
MKQSISRRRFLKGVAGTGAALFCAPRILSAASPNELIHYAFIATSGRGRAHIGLADNKTGICVAYCDVDEKHWGKLPQQWPKAKAFTDYRKMFDKCAKDIDAVTVATPDHNHATASLMAMKLGKHVYCEKPLTWSIHEAREMARLCAEKKLATQMGNQGHANEGNRLIVEWVRSGMLGDITEVHTWTNRPIWPQGITKRPPSKPVPAGLNWDAWIGPAPFRKYHDGLHNFKWRGWFDFGCGAVGDMGCHTWDSVNWSLQPDYPTSVELVEIQGDGYPETYPKKSHFKWIFPAKGKRKGFVAHWYAGGLKPPIPEGTGIEKLPGSGNLYIGTKAVLFVRGDYGQSPRIVPESKMKEIGKPPRMLERSPGHHAEWVMAVKGEKPWDYPKSNFLYAGPMTELMLLGCVAIKLNEVGRKIECDPTGRKILSKLPAVAAAMVERTPRKGWEV